MKIETSRVERLMVTEVDGLDPVAVYLEDQGEGRGKIMITCYGKAWTAYWPAMGSGIRDFVLSADNGYLIGKLDSRIERWVMAYDQAASYARKRILSKRREGEVSKDAARAYWNRTEALEGVSCKEDIYSVQDVLREICGWDWYDGFPQEKNHEYKYLERIVAAVKDALHRRVEASRVDWKERLEAEREGLSERLARLSEFTRTDTFHSLPEVDKYLLRRQHDIMAEYLEVLDVRVELSRRGA